MTTPSPQLTLPVRLRDDETFESFRGGRCAETVRHLRQLARGDASGCAWLWGPKGSGKSHLLQACCHEAHGRGRGIMYLPLADVSLEDEAFASLSHRHVVCIDDAEHLVRSPELERAFVPLFSDLETRGAALVMASGAPPREIAFSLADARSRAASAALHRLPGLDDAARLGVLRHRASLRGLTLSEEVGRFILARASRDMDALMKALDALDVAALRHKRRLTIPFVKEVLRF